MPAKEAKQKNQLPPTGLKVDSLAAHGNVTLAATGQVLGIKVLDHIVVGDGRYYSFKEGARL